MKLLLCSLFLFVTHTASAALNLKPGLWEVKTRTGSGKDPMEELKKNLAKMSPEQRKQMEAALSQQGVSIGQGNAIRVCYTNDLLKSNEALMNRAGSQSGCTHKITEQSSSKMVMQFNCKDGTRGNGTWNLTSKEAYNGLMKFTDAKGAQSQIRHEAKFVSSNCGKVKPLQP